VLPASSLRIVRLAQVRFEFETLVVDRPTKTEVGFLKLRTAKRKLLLVVETTNFFAIFEVLTTVLLNTAVFWVVTPCAFY
jgi:hypothetical protein